MLAMLFSIKVRRRAHICLRQRGQHAAARRAPDPPPFLRGHAADEWRRVAVELHAIGLLSALDVMPLAAYCAAYARWRQAEELLATMAAHHPAEVGLLIRTADGVARNPIAKIASRAAADMVRYASEFGFSPAARARLGHRRFRGAAGRQVV
jgi:P27 family predicted phage terminase small subunit